MASVNYKSFIIFGVPKSGSSSLYSTLCGALPFLEKPVYTTVGEFMNFERNIHLKVENDIHMLRGGEKTDMLGHLVDNGFRRRIQFIDHLVQREGFLYKDVVQPFLVASWFQEENYPLDAIFIDRPIEQVIYRHEVADQIQGREDIENLASTFIEAKNKLLELSIPKLDFDDFIFDEDVLKKIVSDIYSDTEVEDQVKWPELNYIDDDFKEKRENRLKDRESERFSEVSDIISQVK